jgi:ankyrin repeat protein
MSHPYDAFLAIEHGNLARLKELLAEEPALAAARDEQGVALVLRAAYRYRPELDLYGAAAIGDVARVTHLLERDHAAAETFAGDGFNALQLACFFAQPACARLLLERGASVEAVSKNGMELRALHAAAAGRSHEVVDLLLAHGADANAPQHGGWTALHAAVNNRDAKMVSALLARGADPKRANEFGKTPLDLAREKNDEAVLRLLQG